MKKFHTKTWQRPLRSLVSLCLGLAIALMTNLPFFNSFFLAAAQPPAPVAKSASELRGVWLTNVDSDVLFSRDKLSQAVQRLKRLNFNTIYPTVWHEGYTLYPSVVAENTYGKAVSPIPELQGRDMLAEAIELGHEQKLAVIPWFEFGLMSEERAELTRLHPEWLTSRKDGSKVFVYGDRGQHRFVWLNPLRPEVQKLLVDLIMEVVTKYNVDGIQIDDHFGMPAELGYDDYTIALYQKEHKGKRPPEDINDPEWTRWRSHFVTNLMVKIFASIKTTKPNCLISLSPNPRAFSYQHYLQDWYRWVDLGFINELIVQVYRSKLAEFVNELESPELREVRKKIPVGIGVLAGLRVQNVAMELIESQVKATRDRNFQGFSFFFYETLGDRDPAFANLLPAPAIRPSKPLARKA
ncbi:family 10 glycosylhydrolase [Tumidithrix helvetica PCC 7403]|uniref:glycoside hydrolase family 10 protein n=1 Tax=Tumidithrix helvetica TaxID=3457545 RepID=UPI003C8656F3